MASSWIAAELAAWLEEEAPFLSMRGTCREWRATLDSVRFRSVELMPARRTMVDLGRCASCGARAPSGLRVIRYAYDLPPGRVIVVCRSWRCGAAALWTWLEDARRACVLPTVSAASSTEAVVVRRTHGGLSRGRVAQGQSLRWRPQEPEALFFLADICLRVLKDEDDLAPPCVSGLRRCTCCAVKPVDAAHLVHEGRLRCSGSLVFPGFFPDVVVDAARRLLPPAAFH